MEEHHYSGHGDIPRAPMPQPQKSVLDFQGSCPYLCRPKRGSVRIQKSLGRIDNTLASAAKLYISPLYPHDLRGRGEHVLSIIGLSYADVTAESLHPDKQGL